ncbi:MAG: hypothetical protein LBU36_03800 [Clostridiales bacterium]|jgi:hypothetical protein|nr:hypothetical protein [Clostridiales bacterium]
MNLVAETLREVTKYAVTDREAFARRVQETLSAKQPDEVKTQKKQLVKLQARQSELEMLFRRIYEDNALGKLPDKRFAALSAEYEREQTEIESQIPELQTAVERYESGS